MTSSSESEGLMPPRLPVTNQQEDERRLVEPQDSTPDLLTANLGRQLSRLAGIQGKSIPAYRFEYLSETSTGVPIAQISPALRAIELWADQFPEGVKELVSVQDVEKDSFPLLWLEPSAQRVLIARGKLVSGEFSLENFDGALERLSKSDVAKGVLLRLTTGATKQATDDPRLAPKSASEWFLFVVKKHSRLFLEACLASVAASIVAMATAMYTMQVYDRVVPNNGFDTLWALTFAVVIGIAFEFLMKQIRVEIVERSCKAIDI
jgi:ATP-binding cassette, subfamily C, bacterial LapB